MACAKGGESDDLKSWLSTFEYQLDSETYTCIYAGLSQGFRVAGSVPKVGGCRENLAAKRQGTMRFAHRSGRVWKGGGPPPIGGVWGASPENF